VQGRLIALRHSTAHARTGQSSHQRRDFLSLEGKPAGAQRHQVLAVESATHDTLRGMSEAEEVRDLMCDDDSDEIVVPGRGEPRVAAVL
jgi:hypothetical protein